MNEDLEDARVSEESFEFILLQNGWVKLPYGRIEYDPDAAREELSS